MKTNYRRVDACRSCGSRDLTEVLDLGSPYISDFVDDPTRGERAPLLMVRCQDCTLVQTRHTVDRERLFRETYWYRSGTNESMVAALRDVVNDACSRVELGPDDHALDIGANDGTLLGAYPRMLTCDAVEPSNVETANAFVTVRGYFPEDFLVARAAQPKWGARAYKVITSIAMFYAQDDPHAFVAAIKRILHPEGVWVVQLQDLASVLRDRAFDYFCHEHLALYSLHSFERLIHEHGLMVADWSTNDTNGGSLRIIVKHGGKLTTSVRPEDEGTEWDAFQRDVLALRERTVGTLATLKAAGKLVLGYGASTKGNTLLQFYGITPDLLPAIAERQEAKHGKFTVGTGIPIISEEEARRQKPAYFFALPWHFLRSFEQRESVPFIVPLPTLRVHKRALVAA